ncbi:MAG: hypothetical protein HY901_04600 [Deltaproteobacteria bacterium]|nr:hypothetical protein [Deltaproteobacteria bacterium]
MRERILFPLLILLLAVAVPAPVSAQSDEIPRLKPRVTDPDAPAGSSDETVPVAPRPKKRKNAISLDDEAPPAPEGEESAPPSKKRRTSSDLSSDEAASRSSDGFEDSDSPRPSKKRRRSSSSDDDYLSEPRRSSAYDDDDLRDDRGSGRSIRTAEEELAGDEVEEKSLSREDERGTGGMVELVTGPIFLSSPTGGVTTRGFFGFDVGVNLGRYLFASEWQIFHDGLYLEATYLGSKASLGTEEVLVESQYHYLSLEVLAGFPITTEIFRSLAYLKIGPAMMIMPVTYDVQGNLTDFTGVKGGIVYGIGFRSSMYFAKAVGFSCRLELARYRRGYLDDTLLTVGAGVAF